MLFFSILFFNEFHSLQGYTATTRYKVTIKKRKKIRKNKKNRKFKSLTKKQNIQGIMQNFGAASEINKKQNFLQKKDT